MAFVLLAQIALRLSGHTFANQVLGMLPFSIRFACSNRPPSLRSYVCKANIGYAPIWYSFCLLKSPAVSPVIFSHSKSWVCSRLAFVLLAQTACRLSGNTFAKAMVCLCLAFVVLAQSARRHTLLSTHGRVCTRLQHVILRKCALERACAVTCCCSLTMSDVIAERFMTSETA